MKESGKKSALCRNAALILICLAVFVCPQAHAGSSNDVTSTSCQTPSNPLHSIAGLADVEWVRKGREYRFEAAIRIDSPEKASFQALDDFGNTLFGFRFSGKNDLKVSRISLSRSELVNYLLNRATSLSTKMECRYDRRSRLFSIEKKSKRKRSGHLVFFSDFQRKGKFSYPHRIEIAARKGSIKILWKQIDRIH